MHFRNIEQQAAILSQLHLLDRTIEQVVMKIQEDTTKLLRFSYYLIKELGDREEAHATLYDLMNG